MIRSCPPYSSTKRVLQRIAGITEASPAAKLAPPEVVVVRMVVVAVEMVLAVVAVVVLVVAVAGASEVTT